jgi:serine/threonine protein kinase
MKVKETASSQLPVCCRSDSPLTLTLSLSRCLLLSERVVDLTHFTMCRVLGRGGFGKVNAVLRRSDEQYFAMKSISKHKLIRQSRSQQLCHTACAVSLPSHPLRAFSSCTLRCRQGAVHLYGKEPSGLTADTRAHHSQARLPHAFCSVLLCQTWLERKVMSSFQSEFLVSCVYAFQDADVRRHSTAACSRLLPHCC